MVLDRPYERHVFVCTRGPWCRLDGAKAVQGVLKDGIKRAGLRDACRVNQSGCLNQCGRGPMVVVYPDAVWYAGVDRERAMLILDRHLVGGQPVDEIRYHPPKAGNNKTPEIRRLDAARKGQD